MGDWGTIDILSLHAAQIMSPEEFEQQLASHGLDLVVLMCKAHSCRPCKVGTACLIARMDGVAECFRLWSQP